MIEIAWNPTRRQLIQFSWIAAIAIPAITAIWTRGQFSPVAISAAIGLIIACAGSIRPSLVKPLYLGLTLVTFPIGLVVGEISLLLIFLLVFTPMALLFRLIRRDKLQRTIDRQSDSYWTDKARPRNVESYFRQW